MGSIKYKALAFDVDGTLYPNNLMYLHSIPFALGNYSLLKAISKVRKELRKIRPIDDFLGLQAKMVGDEMGISTEQATELVHDKMYREWEKVLYRVPLFPGVKELLEELRRRSIKLGVASDFPVERKLKILGVEGYWDFELATEDTHYLKPNPEPFLALASGLGERPEDILYVGNSYAYDVLGAKSIGMAAAHVTKKPEPNSVADLSFYRYKDLAEYLFR
ncbi:MAG: HAD family hydrolase [Spirochaetales bacterium]|nr:HAD family hydrolase [Spirochaetales bacterium]